MNYCLDAGLSFAPEPYNPYTNPNNEFVSSIIMVYVGIGAGVKYTILNRLELGAGFTIKHYSNGRMGMPNKGINIVGIDAGMRYYFSPIEKEMKKINSQPFIKKMNYHFSVAGGMHTSIEEWEIYAQNTIDPDQRMKNFKYYPKFSASADAIYQFFRKYSAGIGFDLFYIPSISKHQEWDKIIYGEEKVRNVKYNPLSLGIAINQQVSYKNLSVYASFGYYVFRELGIRQRERDFYQRAGLRYYFPSLHNLYVGYGIKSHKFNTAEYLELSIGMNFGRNIGKL